MFIEDLGWIYQIPQDLADFSAAFGQHHRWLGTMDCLFTNGLLVGNCGLIISYKWILEIMNCRDNRRPRSTDRWWTKGPSLGSSFVHCFGSLMPSLGPLWVLVGVVTRCQTTKLSHLGLRNILHQFRLKRTCKTLSNTSRQTSAI